MHFAWHKYYRNIFLLMGAYLSISQKNMVTTFPQKKNIYLVIAILGLVSCVVFDSTKVALLSQQVYCVAAVSSLIPITAMLLNKGVLTVRPQLSQTSFFCLCVTWDNNIKIFMLRICYSFN